MRTKGKDGKNGTSDPERLAGVLAPPDEVFTSIDRDSDAAGGAWKPPEGEEGCIGHTMFDAPTSEDGTVTVLLPREHIDRLPSQALVQINSKDGRVYLGATVEGPFAEPDGLRADATPLVITAIQGTMLVPKY